MSSKELPKVIDKSQADIDAAINRLQRSQSLSRQRMISKPHQLSLLLQSRQHPSIAQNDKGMAGCHILLTPTRLNMHWQ